MKIAYVKSRLLWMDNARAFSILLIIIFHISGQVFNAGRYIDGYWRWFRLVTYEGVHVFFFISGYGLSLGFIGRDASQLLGSWLHRRIVKLLPLYWLVLIFTFLLYVLGCPLKITPYIYNQNYFFDFLLHGAFLHTLFYQTFYSINVAWWFLPVIIFCYMLFPFLFNLINKKVGNCNIGLCVVVLSVFAFAFLNRVIFLGNPQIIDGISFFIFGMLSFFIKKNNGFQFIHSRKQIIFIFVISFVIVCLFLVFFGRKSIFLSIFMLITIISLSMCTHKVSVIDKVLKMFSDASYPLYLIHWPFIYPVFFFNRKFDLFDIPLWLDLIVSFAFYFAIVLFLAQSLIKCERLISAARTVKI